MSRQARVIEVDDDLRIQALDLLDGAETLNRETRELEEQAHELDESVRQMRERISSQRQSVSEMSADAKRLLAVADEEEAIEEQKASRPDELGSTTPRPGYLGAPGKMKKGGVPGEWSPGSTKL